MKDINTLVKETQKQSDTQIEAMMEGAPFGDLEDRIAKKSKFNLSASRLSFAAVGLCLVALGAVFVVNQTTEDAPNVATQITESIEDEQNKVSYQTSEGEVIVTPVGFDPEFISEELAISEGIGQQTKHIGFDKVNIKLEGAELTFSEADFNNPVYMGLNGYIGAGLEEVVYVLKSEVADDQDFDRLTFSIMFSDIEDTWVVAETRVDVAGSSSGKERKFSEGGVPTSSGWAMRNILSGKIGEIDVISTTVELVDEWVDNEAEYDLATKVGSIEFENLRVTVIAE